jgi:hypothetical protein
MTATALAAVGSNANENGTLIISGTAVASTSGTSIDFTGIPSYAKRVTVLFGGVSTSGTNNLLVQVGSGSVSTTGYVSASGRTNSANNAAMNTNTTGVHILNSSASDALRGAVVLYLLTGNTWVANGNITSDTTLISITIGATCPALSGALDRIRVTSVGGTDTFDAGTINIFWE